MSTAALRSDSQAIFTEGSQMFKRGGKYYFMWSEDGWTGPNYAVAYAISDSPTGPFTELGRVLTQDSAVARGSGHNSVINVPGTDIWYIAYHRRPLSRSGANDRQLAYDRMTFNADGTIQPVTMRVEDNFDDNNAIGWTTHGGTWTASGGRYETGASYGGKSLLDTNFTDFVQDADITPRSANGDSGVVFRATQATTGTDAYRGYYAGITGNGRVVLGKADNNWTQLASAPVTVRPNVRHHLRVEAVGSSIKVYVGDLTTPKISVIDTSFTSGANGVRVFNTGAAFDDFAVAHR
ncbi:family 43 glycosylhydrolase [Lentzea sp. CA-135723]|uniref:family 43 glycosylhydrolase n=1 Tax=Lentzea sp. CA-135723 TaxID=3239950 RepID=UPI003D8D4ECE